MPPRRPRSRNRHFAPCTSPKSYSALSDGDYDFQVRATDESANTEDPPAYRSFTVVDTTPPTTTIDSGPTGTTNDNNPSFAFSSEAGATFECRLDGPEAATGSFAPCTSPKAYTGLSDGDYTFQVRATDEANNTEAPPVERSFTIDTTPPPDQPPVISKLKVVPNAFPVSGGTTALERKAPAQIEITLSEDATVTFKVRRKSPEGRGGPPPKSPRKFKRQLSAGSNSVPFTGKLGKLKLKPRRYTLTARARDSAKQASERVSTGFQIIKLVTGK